MNGNIFGFSVGGAVALFVFIWWFGTRASMKAQRLDELNDEIRALQEDLEKAQRTPRTGTLDPPRVFRETDVYSYRIKKRRKKRIALITGNIQGVRIADIWVNSENTNMQMSRWYEKSVSGTIRYLGAEIDDGGEVTNDLIQIELSEKMAKLKRGSVLPATILVTGSGRLKKTHNVKTIFHAASVIGQVGSGFRPIENIEYCVKNALEKADEVRDDKELCTTILFPLFGAGQAGGGPEAAAMKLLTVALEYLEDHQDTVIDTIYFQIWSDNELQACRKVLEDSGRVEAEEKE